MPTRLMGWFGSQRQRFADLAGNLRFNRRTIPVPHA